jgi:hypothetical protein
MSAPALRASAVVKIVRGEASMRGEAGKIKGELKINGYIIINVLIRVKTSNKSDVPI